jgi:hypothetical protein
MIMKIIDYNLSGNRLRYFLPGLESVGGNRVFSATLWQHFIPAGSLITVNECDGPLKGCRVDEKPAANPDRRRGLTFWSFWVKPKGQYK